MSTDKTSEPNDLADALEAEGWPSVAEDVRDGVPLGTIASRLHRLGVEGEDVEAAQLVIAGAAEAQAEDAEHRQDGRDEMTRERAERDAAYDAATGEGRN